MKNDKYASYFGLNEMDCEEKIQEAQRCCNLYRVNINVKRFLDDFLKDIQIEEFDVRWQGEVIEKFCELAKAKMDKRTNKDTFIDRSVELIIPKFAEYIYQKALVGRCRRLTVREVSTLLNHAEEEYSFDKKLWRKVLIGSENFSFEFRVQNTFNNLIVQHSQLYPNLLMISYDTAEFVGHGDQIKMKHIQFRHYPKLVIDIETDLLFICKDQSHPDLPEEPLEEYPCLLSPLCDGSSMLNKENKYYGAHASLESIGWNHVTLVKSKEELDYAMANGFYGVSRGVLAFQWVLRQYFDIMENVTTVERVATAEKRLSSRSSANTILIEGKNKEDPQDNYVSLSSMAVRRVYERKEWQGGHHESPHPHDVREHERHLKNGKVVKVKAYHKDSPKYTGSKKGTVIIVK